MYQCQVRMGVLPVPPVLPYENVDVLSLLPVVSPHILGEVVVASERGAAVLWTVRRGLVLLLTVHSSPERGQNPHRGSFFVRFYQDTENPWRWRKPVLQCKVVMAMVRVLCPPTSRTICWPDRSGAHRHQGERRGSRCWWCFDGFWFEKLLTGCVLISHYCAATILLFTVTACDLTVSQKDSTSKRSTKESWCEGGVAALLVT